MTKMNPIDVGFGRPLDGGAERNSLRKIVIAAIGIAAFVVGGVMLYTMSISPLVNITKSTPAVEQSIPPATTGQGGTMFNPGDDQMPNATPPVTPPGSR